MAIKGLRGFRYVPLTSDDVDSTVYSEQITKLVGARNINMTPNIAEGMLYGDDQLQESESSITSIEVSMDMTDLPLKQRAELTGQKYENGVLKENKDAEAIEVAFGFQAPKSGGGFRMVWLLKGKIKPLEESAQTKEEDIDYQTQEATFVFTPRLSDGELRFIADTDAEEAPTEEQFFDVAFLEDATVLP